VSGSRIVVAMSGGVDSSVAALLLRDRGFQVTGLFMRLGHHGSGPGRGCCSAEDAADARRIADLLGIPFYAVNFEPEFGRLVDGFVDEYRRGRTPNPCILCNRDLKFGRLFGFAAAAGAEVVATGHYASVVETAGRMAVRRGADREKDQSYVLFPLSQGQLRRTLLPLGDLAKAEVREIARRAGLPVAEKPESQDVCFVPAGGYRELLRSRGAATPGDIVDERGEKVGRHAGLEFFTIGQRRGLGAHRGPRYVTGIDPGSATVRIGPKGELYRAGLLAERWNGGGRFAPLPGESFLADVQVRYRHAAARAVVTGRGDGTAEARFAEPQASIAPGQAAVAYEGDLVAGGGWIARALD
jgi:tRNA-uridine 2-sulfurtransferase